MEGVDSPAYLARESKIGNPVELCIPLYSVLRMYNMYLTRPGRSHRLEWWVSRYSMYDRAQYNVIAIWYLVAGHIWSPMIPSTGRHNSPRCNDSLCNPSSVTHGRCVRWVALVTTCLLFMTATVWHTLPRVIRHHRPGLCIH